MNTLLKSLVFSLIVHLVVAIGIYSWDKYQEQQMFQNIQMEFDNIEDLNSGIVFATWSDIRYETLTFYACLTVPLLMGCFVIFMRTRTLTK